MCVRYIYGVWTKRQCSRNTAILVIALPFWHPYSRTTPSIRTTFLILIHFTFKTIIFYKNVFNCILVWYKITDLVHEWSAFQQKMSVEKCTYLYQISFSFGYFIFLYYYIIFQLFCYFSVSQFNPISRTK